MRTETSPRLFCVCKELEAQPLLEIEIFQASYLHEICSSKTIKTCSNQLADLHRFLFYRGFYEN